MATSRQRRGPIVRAVVVALALSVGLLTPATASSEPLAGAASEVAPMAGGGCAGGNRYPVPGGRPWNGSACSADNGATVFADGYINTVGSVVGSCQLRVGLIDRTTGLLIKHRNDSCYAGHHPAVSAPKVPGHRYESQLRLNTNGTYEYWNSLITY